jgi:hypothetical protein
MQSMLQTAQISRSSNHYRKFIRQFRDESTSNKIAAEERAVVVTADQISTL